METAKTKPMVVGNLALATALVAVVGLFVQPEFRTITDALAIAALWAACLLPLFLIGELRKNPCHPLAIMVFKVFVFYAIRAVVLEVTDRMELEFPFATSAMEQLATACYMVAISVVCYVAGFFWSAGAKLARALPVFYFPTTPQRQSQLRHRAMVLYFIGWLPRLLFISMGFVAFPMDYSKIIQFKSILDDAAYFCSLSLLVLAILVLRREIPKTALIPVFVGELAYGVLNGQRSVFIYPFLLLVLAYAYYRRPPRWSFVVGGAMAIFFVVAPVLTLYKTAYQDAFVAYGKRVSTGMVRDAIGQSQQGTTDVRDLIGGVSDRFGGLDGLPLVLERVRNGLPLEHGNTFLPKLVYAFVPRVLYPEKPDMSTSGRLFAQVFHGDTNTSRVGTAVSIGNVAELYWNWGWWGLLLLPLWGLIVRFFWERFKFYLAVEHAGGLRFPSFLDITDYQSDLTLYFGGLVRGPFGFYLYMMLLYGRLPAIGRIPAPAPKLAPGALGVRAQSPASYPRPEPAIQSHHLV